MDDNAAKRKRTTTCMTTTGLQTPITPTFMPLPDVSAAPTPKVLPSQIISVSEQGDAIIILTGIAGFSNLIGLRVSTEVLSITSPELKRLLAEAQTMQVDTTESRPDKVLSLTADNGTAMCTLLNVLHLRNDVLPARLEPIDLSRLVEVAAKYQCIPAVGRATSPWFDHIFTRHPNPPLYQMTQAAMILGDAIYFARFSSRWVLHEALAQISTPTIPMREPLRMLSRALLQRMRDGLQTLRADVDDLVNPLAETMCSDATHFVDSPPGDGPIPVNMGGDEHPVHCTIDKDGAVEYLAALRDAKIWPAAMWPDENLKAITDAVAMFRIPEYDASDHCHFCIHIEDEFAAGVDDLKAALQDRLWGLCLDCYKLGGVNPGDCRFEHSKPNLPTLALKAQNNASGRQD